MTLSNDDTGKKIFQCIWCERYYRYTAKFMVTRTLEKEEVFLLRLRGARLLAGSDCQHCQEVQALVVGRRRDDTE
jgi:hypothetical protein